MAKYILSICFAAALCYFAEGATPSDLQGAIGRNGALVRRDANRLIGQADAAALGGPGPVDPVKRSCVQTETNLAHRDLSIDIRQAEDQLRLEASTRTPEELAPLAVVELDNQVRERIQNAVDGHLQAHINAIGQC